MITRGPRSRPAQRRPFPGEIFVIIYIYIYVIAYISYTPIYLRNSDIFRILRQKWPAQRRPFPGGGILLYCCCRYCYYIYIYIYTHVYIYIYIYCYHVINVCIERERLLLCYNVAMLYVVTILYHYVTVVQIVVVACLAGCPQAEAWGLNNPWGGELTISYHTI